MWILTGGNHQVHTWWQVLEHKGEGIVNRSGINNVVVVKDENEIVLDGGDFIEQGRQNCFGWWWLRGLERTQHPFSNVWGNGRLQSSDEVSQKACGVAIPFVQRKPGGWPLATGEPFAQQRGFTKACRGRDEAQFAMQILVQLLDQEGPEDNFGLRWGDVEFSGQDWRRHRSILECRPIWCEG